MGFPSIGINGFGIMDEKGLSLVPNPPAIIITCAFRDELEIRLFLNLLFLIKSIILPFEFITGIKEISSGILKFLFFVNSLLLIEKEFL